MELPTSRPIPLPIHVLSVVLSHLAVAAYNAGPKAASRWERQLGGSPDRDIYLAWIGYPETRHYVEKVLIDREIYDWLITAGSGD